MHQSLVKGIELVYRERFTESEKLFKRISKKWSSHPAGPFFQAVAVDAAMQYYATDRDEENFFELCDKAIQLGKKAVRDNPQDLWSLFFVGGANGYKGTYEARFKRWISAFRNGFEGVNILKKLANANPSFVDAGMGIGTYYYWRSKLMKTLWWMPGVEDKREEGIRMLRKTMEQGIYSKEASANNLMGIFIEEKRYLDALAVAERMLEIYPNCRIFLWGKAECHFRMKQWKKAEETFRYLLNTIEANAFDNHYNAINCRLHLARISYERRVYYKALADCRRIQGYVLKTKVREMAKDMLKEANNLLKKSEKKCTK